MSVENPKTTVNLWPAIIGAIALFLSIVGSTCAAYVALRADLSSLEAKFAAQEVRISATEREVETQHKENADYQLEMRGSVAHAVDLLTDLRLLVAGEKVPHGK